MTIQVKQTQRNWQVMGSVDGVTYETYVVADKLDNTVDTGSGNDYVPAEFAQVWAETVLVALEWLKEG